MISFESHRFQSNKVAWKQLDIRNVNSLCVLKHRKSNQLFFAISTKTQITSMDGKFIAKACETLGYVYV